MSEILEPIEKDLEAFWTHAVIAAKLYPASAYAGQDDITSLRPAAFAFGATREEADELAQLVVDGKKTATSGIVKEYLSEGEPLPVKGDMAIVADGRGIPRALIRNTRVEITPFAEVGDAVALAEGEGDLEHWREVHEAFFAEHIPSFAQGSDGEARMVVTEFFEVLYADHGGANRSSAGVTN
ncbi:MAG: ASCH domain-containing protein [Actinomycetaceae bacterium]|nr:ASCH domain-containing protein [Arcanobacterium sp.]MDD7504596.1 ASCH domain-containing protein [Actinomycetaceae bacterium]